MSGHFRGTQRDSMVWYEAHDQDSRAISSAAGARECKSHGTERIGSSGTLAVDGLESSVALPGWQG